MANVSWVCPTIHPRPRHLRTGRARALDRLPRRRGAAPGRRDDPARRHARRPDRGRPVHRSGARRRGLGGVPRRDGRSHARLTAVADRDGHGATIPRAPRWTVGLEPAAPRSETATSVIDARARPAMPSPGGSRWPSAPTTPRPTSRRPTAGIASTRSTTTSTCRPTSARPFMKLPGSTDPAELRRREVDVAIIGAPFDDAVSHRSGARFGPRAIREAQYTSGRSTRSSSTSSRSRC